MNFKCTGSLALLLCFVNIVSAQVVLPMPRNIQPLYEANTRTLDGKPGKNYWQNTANYDINVLFDPASLLINGNETITYFNNSPDTLMNILFKLYPNLYAKGAEREAAIDPADAGEGVKIDKVSVTNSKVLTYSINGTNMNVTIPPLLPKQSIVFNIGYHYNLNKASSIRTGQVEENAAFIAYFFPRIAVYDDIDGWNRNQYLGSQEFYNDFCNFKASVTVPKDFVVWATGDLKNCSEVFTSKYCDRIQQAEKNDAITTIIDSSDLLAGGITTDNVANTWRFEANNVTDFVFATTDHYMWKSSSLVVDAASGRRTRVDAVFNAKHKDYFDVLHYNRETVKAMSYTFPKWPYPYSHETVFDGLDQMEYPMMVNDNPTTTSFDAITLTDHEVFHTMFPFYMGINETKYAWMDEGWATIGEWLISPLIDTTIVDDYGIKSYEDNAGSEIDVPITTLTTLQNGSAMFLNSYVKPGLGYLYVKDYLGDALFTKALHYYIGQWHGKHPMPYDFFNCINTSSGKDLNWFWKNWFFDSGTPDLAITDVKRKGTKYTVTIKSKGTKFVPVDLNITFTDNSIAKEHKSIAAWEKGVTTTTISFNAGKEVQKLMLGSTWVPDINKDDNIWVRQ
jgi:hypothetical protein